ncbi:AAA family ATPase, partial [archaeon]|nr:AAA family ATPase [archaeon]
MTKINRLVMNGFKSFAKHTELVFSDDFSVIIGPNGSGKSTRADTKVILSDGRVRKIGDLVDSALSSSKNLIALDDGVFTLENNKRLKILSLDPESMSLVEKPIKAFIRRDGEPHLFKITTKTGRSVVTTGCHPVMIFKDGKVRSEIVGNLSKGVRIATPNKLNVFERPATVEIPCDINHDLVDGNFLIKSRKLSLKIPKIITSEFARFLGYLTGDGCILSNRCDFVNADREVIEDYLKICTDLGCNVKQYKYQYRGKATNLTIHSVDLVKILVGLLGGEFKREKKHIPERILFGAKSILANFLSALFDCDSSVEKNNPTFEYVTMSETLADQVQTALLRFNIISIRKEKLKCATNTKDKKKRKYNYIMVDGKDNLRKLEEVICFKSKHKKERLHFHASKTYNSNNNLDLLPMEVNKIIRDCVNILRIPYKPLRKEHPKLAAYIENRCCPSKKGVEEVLEIFLRKLNILNKSGHSRVLRQRNLINTLKRTNIPFTYASKSLGLSHSTITASWRIRKSTTSNVNLLNLDRFIKEDTLPRVCFAIPKLNVLRNLAKSDILWDELVCIEKVAGEKYVYDLSVDDTHNFIANNIFVHNSNVLDALCFVLGKSSSKSLRAEKSSNLIYNGGKTKKPANEAEVSIFFDNKEKTFPLTEEEIKISRVVKQNGASKYLINGKTKTRQEVLELLSHSKIDPDGYNIILQGDIVRLIEMSTIERRQIIEEIAGIGVYEEKKNKALLELSHVEEKIKEAEIILKEREGYLKDLKKEKEQALKFKEIKDKIDSYKASHLKKQVDRKQSEKEKIDSKIKSIEETLNKVNEVIKNLREEKQQNQEKIKEISDEIEKQGEKGQISLNKEIEQLRVEVATNNTKTSNYKDEINRIEKRKIELSKSSEDLEIGKKELLAQRKSLEETKTSLEKDLISINNYIKEFRKKHKLDESNALEEQTHKLDEQIEQLQKEAQELRESYQNSLREKDKLEYQLETIDDKINKVNSLLSEHKKEIEDLKEKKKSFKTAVLDLNNLLNEDVKHARRLADLREKMFSKRQEKSKLELRRDEFKESISTNIAVKKILENKSRLGGIHGTVAELGEADKKYSLALEIAAAQKIQSIVVEDDKTAVKCINYLKQNKLGTATFLPLNKINPYPVKEEVSKLKSKDGILGLAIELINYSPQYKNIFSYVFGNTLIVNTIETARSVGIGKTKMVSLDGDIAEMSGAMVGGYRHKKDGSFKEKNIQNILDKVEEELAEVEDEINNLEKTRKENEERISRLREHKATLEGDIIKQEKALHLNTDDLDEDRKYKEDINESMKKIEETLKAEESRIEQKINEITQLKVTKQTLRDQIVQLKKPTLIAELNAFEEKRNKLVEERIKLEAELNNINNREKEVFGKSEDQLETTRETLIKEKQELENKIKQQDEESKTKNQVLKEKEKEQEKFHSQFKQLFDKRNKAQDLITAVE